MARTWLIFLLLLLIDQPQFRLQVMQSPSVGHDDGRDNRQQCEHNEHSGFTWAAFWADCNSTSQRQAATCWRGSICIRKPFTLGKSGTQSRLEGARRNTAPSRKA